jgi:hypothetical protein
MGVGNTSPFTNYTPTHPALLKEYIFPRTNEKFISITRVNNNNSFVHQHWFFSHKIFFYILMCVFFVGKKERCHISNKLGMQEMHREMRIIRKYHLMGYATTTVTWNFTLYISKMYEIYHFSWLDIASPVASSASPISWICDTADTDRRSDKIHIYRPTDPILPV